MNAKKCDRCGKYYTINELPPYIPVIDPQYRAGVDLDLCIECIGSFYDWMYTDYYFTEQAKKGRGTPDCKQSCGRCRHFVNDGKRKLRECEFGKEWRDVDEICSKWEPKTNPKEVI